MGLEFLEGNEAIARGAMQANCNFFAGYPITPSSSILQHMLELVPQRGGVAVQAEDEIASIGFCIGAAMTGSKVLTATSGPGISLYSENIGLAIIGETPMVIVNVQRQGPATGSATKGAEGDIQFTRWCTSGGLPVIVLSPAT
ncbi:MAG TPA: pyruvate flavodoxin/ferredoxin oxidoreductase, partial [Gammaproteobacteria bacterium]